MTAHGVPLAAVAGYVFGLALAATVDAVCLAVVRGSRRLRARWSA